MKTSHWSADLRYEIHASFELVNTLQAEQFWAILPVTFLK